MLDSAFLRNLGEEPVGGEEADDERPAVGLGRAGDAEERRRAFEAGAASFGKWGSRYAFDPSFTFSIPALDETLETLLALNGDGKRMLLEAITATVMSDKSLSVRETELIRAICASLDCPLPPILTQDVAA